MAGTPQRQPGRKVKRMKPDAAVLAGGQLATEKPEPRDWTAYGILQAAGRWFSAFAGYARLASLGEEMVNPGVAIPRAISIAPGITLLLISLWRSLR